MFFFFFFFFFFSFCFCFSALFMLFGLLGWLLVCFFFVWFGLVWFLAFIRLNKKKQQQLEDEIFCFAHFQWCHNGLVFNSF